jgi:hypothetical protein
MALAWVCALAVAIPLAAFFSVGPRGERFSTPPKAPPRKAKGVKRLVRWTEFAGEESFSDAIGGRRYVIRLLRHPRRHVASVIGFPLYCLGDMLALWVALRAFGIELDFPTLPSPTRRGTSRLACRFLSEAAAVSRGR